MELIQFFFSRFTDLMAISLILRKLPRIWCWMAVKWWISLWKNEPCNLHWWNCQRSNTRNTLKHMKIWEQKPNLCHNWWDITDYVYKFLLAYLSCQTFSFIFSFDNYHLNHQLLQLLNQVNQKKIECSKIKNSSKNMKCKLRKNWIVQINSRSKQMTTLQTLYHFCMRIEFRPMAVSCHFLHEANEPNKKYNQC